MERAARVEAERQHENAQSDAASPEVQEFSYASEQNDDPRASAAAMATCHDSSEPSSPSQPSHHSEEALFDTMNQEGMDSLDVGPQEIQSQYTSPGHEMSQRDDSAFDLSRCPTPTFAHSACDFPALMPTQSPVMDCQVTAELAMSSAPAPCSLPGTEEDLVNAGFESFLVGAFSNEELEHNMATVAPVMAHDIPQPSVELVYSQTASPVSVAHSPSPPDFRLQSPPAAGLAGRRPNVPAPITIRKTSHGPTTGLNLGSRAMDPGSPLRRVASASGFGPQGIRKPSVAPRSPYLERNPDNFFRLLQTSHAPTLNTAIGMLAPPTPDTPVVSRQALREATVSSCSSEEDQAGFFRQSSMSSLGSTMDHHGVRTPPATPSNIPDMYSYSNIAFTVHDEAVLTPGLQDVFPDLGAPAYPSSCNSHPPTPSFHPVGPMDFQNPFADGAQYAWPTASQAGSPASSPNTRVCQLQFNNYTAEHFNARK
jgi:hypothetical protein